MINPKRIFVIDALAMVHRCFWAFKNLASSDGTPTGAVFGSAGFLTQLIKSQRPDYMVMCMDVGAPTFRHQMYPDYKANRKEKDETLSSQIPLCKELAKCMDIPVLGIAGYEADDLIGSISAQFATDETNVYIVSADKDFMQLINKNVFMYKPMKWPEFEIIDTAKVVEKFGIQPSQVVDALAIIGDAADNIPGVHGIGEKGAAKLIKSYGSLDGVYENFHNVTGKKAIEGLAKSRDSAYLSRDLATIVKDIDLGITLEDMKFDQKSLNNEKLMEFYARLDFASLLPEKTVD